MCPKDHPVPRARSLELRVSPLPRSHTVFCLPCEPLPLSHTVFCLPCLLLPEIMLHVPTIFIPSSIPEASPHCHLGLAMLQWPPNCCLVAHTFYILFPKPKPRGNIPASSFQYPSSFPHRNFIQSIPPCSLGKATGPNMATGSSICPPPFSAPSESLSSVSELWPFCSAS